MRAARVSSRERAHLVNALAAMITESNRSEAAAPIARLAGAHAMIVFVEDVEVGALLPAPGFVQTLPGGKTWPTFLASCRVAAPFAATAATLPAPVTGEIVSAEGRRAEDGSVVVLLGGSASPEIADALVALLPLVAVGLRAEMYVRPVRAQGLLDRAAAREAHALTRALDEKRQELEQQRARLIDALRAKDEFLAMLGHELRNPLAPILSAVEVLRAQAPAGASKALAVIDRQALHLTRLVDDLLDVARITRGGIVLRMSRFEIATVVAKAIEITSPLVSRCGHRVAVHVPTAGLAVHGDESRLAQAMTNLLANAARHSHPDKTITIEATESEGRACLTVRDEGFGIDPADRARIFEGFVQGKQERDRHLGGLGLGLTIARHVVELHGGEVVLRSEGRGRGSAFTIRLPLAPATTLAAATPERATAVAVDGEHRRVLVVDDNVDAACFLAELFTENGFVASVAHDGPSALRVAADFEPAIAIVDIGLPGMDGCELARRLRERDGSIRLIALSGYGQPADRERARNAGFDDYVVKPATIDVLLRLIAPASRTR